VERLAERFCEKHAGGEAPQKSGFELAELCVSESEKQSGSQQNN